MLNVKNILIIGAGASCSEAEKVGLKKELYPPLMNNFANKLWKNDGFISKNHYLVLEQYLINSEKPDFNIIDKITYKEDIMKTSTAGATSTNFEGFKKSPIMFTNQKGFNNQSIDLFLEKEQNSKNNINIENFFAYLWQIYQYNPNKYEGLWQNFILYSVIQPLEDLIINGFTNKDNSFKNLVNHQKILTLLKPNDLIVNLNYETLCEIALEQSNIEFEYLPSKKNATSIKVAKPHGSLNLAISKHKDYGIFYNKPSEFYISLPSNLYRSFGITPPQFNKNHKQNPHSNTITENIKNIIGKEIIFWGVGITNSDINLKQLYKTWVKHSRKVSIINPEQAVSRKIKKELGGNVFQYDDIENYLKNDGNKVI